MIDVLADIKAEMAADEALAASKEAKPAPEGGEAEKPAAEAADGDTPAAKVEDAPAEDKPAGRVRKPPLELTENAQFRLNAEVAKTHGEREKRLRAEADLAAANARIAALDKAASPDGEERPKTQAEMRAEILAEVRAEEAMKTAVNEFNRRADATFAKGVQDYGEEVFTEARDSLGTIGFGSDIGLIQIMLETSAPEKVLYFLSQDLAEAQRIFGLPQAKMAIEMEKMANRRAKPATAPTNKRTSEMPDPVKPVGGDGVATDDDLMDDAIDMAEFGRRWDRREAKRIRQ